MKRLPAVKTIESRILKSKVGKVTANNSVTYLLRNRETLKHYASVEDFVLSTNTVDAKIRKACEYHLKTIRAQLARELWSSHLYIGVTVLDDLLYSAFADDSCSNPVKKVIELIRDYQLHYPGMVIYPIHSFGILAAGMFRWMTKSKVDFSSAKYGFALSPQTNKITDSISFLERTAVTFGIKKSIPSDRIRDWFRSSSAKWLECNPLLVVKVQSYPGDYYENQFLLVIKLRIITTFISMLAVLQPDEDESSLSKLWSSSSINNFQTLDIKHYFVLFNSPNRRNKLDGDRVPMHLRRPALAEISDLAVDLDPRFWRKKNKTIDRIFSALQEVHSGYIKYSFGSNRNSTLGKVYRKILNSLIFFRRSYQQTDEDWSSTVTLAVAFEVLLTDKYAGGVNDRINRRVSLLLKGIPHSKKMIEVVEKLYEARSKVVHHGNKEIDIDMKLARKAYIHVLIRLVKNINILNPHSTAPMKDLCQDAKP